MARRPIRATIVLATVVLATAAAASLAVPAAGTAASALASAGPQAVVRSGAWSRVTPPGTSIIEDAGLARGSDGVLHVLWTTGVAPRVRVMDTPVSAAGAVQPAVTVSAGWEIATFPDAVATGSGLDVFWGGMKADTGPVGLIESTRPRSGGAWSPFKVPVTDAGGASETLGVTATASRAGQPYVAITRTDVLAISPVPHAFVQIPPTSCCAYTPGLASDSATGATWVAYLSLVSHHSGLFAQRLTAAGHASGPARKLPGSSSPNNDNAVEPLQRVALTSRGGNRAGVFAAYGAGYPTARRVNLLRMGASGARVLAAPAAPAGPVGVVTVASDPAGRLWVAWVVNHGSGRPQLFVRRSNPSLTSFGKAELVPLPAGTDNVWKVYLSPQASQLQLVALTGTSVDGRAAYWTRTMPPPQ